MKKTEYLVLMAIALLFPLPTIAQESDNKKDLEQFYKKVRTVIEQVPPAYVFIGGGSGVVVSSDGYIITNYHVAGKGKKWTVRLTGGKKYTADVVGFDPRGDICLLKIRDGKNLPYVRFGDSDKLAVGQYVIAVGNPFLLGNENWEPTVTLGIVSLIHRYFESYNDAIQTDARINPGNSGGPLITLDGELVGINGMINVRFFNRVNTGVGYAIPSNQIKRFMKTLKQAKGGRDYHGYVEGLPKTETGNNRFDNRGESGDGVLVAGVTEGPPADKAGFLPGDIITDIESYRIFNTKRFHGAIATYPTGEKIKVKIKRKEKDNGWKIIELTVYLGKGGKDSTDKGMSY